MFTLDEAHDILDRTCAAGATASDIFIGQSDLFEGTVRCGEIETVREARSKKLTLRVFFGRQSAVIATSDFTPASLSALVTDTCALARLSSEDPCAGLPEPEQIATSMSPMNGADPAIAVLSLDDKMNIAKRAEKAAFASDPRITNSDGANLEHGTQTLIYAATNGFSGSYTHSTISLSVTPIASDQQTMQRDYGYSTRRSYKELQSAEEVGVLAGRRAARRLGARSVATQTVPVVFDPETATALLSHYASALSGYALYKKASFLVDQMGKKVASDKVTIDDDPTLPGGLGTRPFDGEGLPSRKKRVVEKGVLRHYLLDTYSGRKLGFPSTGNAVGVHGSAPTVGVSNFHMMPGEVTPEAVLQSVSRGLYVTELIGFGVNEVTGDYSQGAAGFWIENGTLAFPVEEVTLAGNLKEMFLHIEAVGNDLSPWKKIAAPTIRIACMTVAGRPRRD